MTELKTIVEKLFPLPAPENRRDGIIPLRSLFHPGFKLENDSDYIGYLLFRVVFGISYVILGLLLLDVFQKTGLLIDSSDLAKDKLLLPKKFSELVSPIAILLSVIFYFRLRLTINLREDRITIVGNFRYLSKYKKKGWVWVTLVVMLAGFLCVFAPPFLVIRLAGHYNVQNDLYWVVFIQLFAAYMPALGSFLIVCATVALEKVVRFFPAAYADLISRGRTKKGF